MRAARFLEFRQPIDDKKLETFNNAMEDGVTGMERIVEIAKNIFDLNILE